MKKCVYCNYTNPTEIELSMFLSDIFLRHFLCEKCDAYRDVCPRCRREEMICPDCHSMLIIGETTIDRFDKELKNKNDEAALKILTEMDGEINSKLDAYGSGVVHLSVRAGRVKVLKEAINLGANYQLKNSNNLTPLDFAYLLKRKLPIRIIKEVINESPRGSDELTTPKPDSENAWTWFPKASNQESKDAQNALGKMDEQAQANVVEVPVHDVKDTINSLIEMVDSGDEDALKALHNLAKQGNVNAQYRLGEIYSDVEFENKKAAIWYGKAATQGHAGALEALFEMAEQSDEDALKALHTVAKQGDADIQHRLGVISAEIEFDDAQAAKLYHKAAIQGHSVALDALFEMAAQCDENAFKSLRSIARQGDADIQYRLGSIYSEVECDDKKAAIWYRKAIKQGHAEAQNALDALAE